MTLRHSLAAMLMLVAWLGAPVSSAARAESQGTPRSLAWKDLLPPAAQKAKPFWLPRRRAADDDSPPPAPVPEGRWLSRRIEQTPINVEVVKSLDGARVRLGGYVVPLDFDATHIAEFLLVPFVGACVHVPPPPPNQLVLVKSARPFEVKGLFDPVFVTGTIRVSSVKTGLADAGYLIEADLVEPGPRPAAEGEEDK